MGCSIPERTAQHYLKLHNHSGQLEGGKSEMISDLTVNEAVKLISKKTEPKEPKEPKEKKPKQPKALETDTLEVRPPMELA